MPSARARLFFALWPDAPVRDALAAAAASVQADCGGRATPSAKIHLTLFFLGEVERSRMAALCACAAKVSAAAFVLDLSVLGYWRHNRIAWAGTRATPPALAHLAADLACGLGALGYRGEDRPYVPHVTLARNVRRPPRSTDLAAPPWPAREFALAQSADGRYEVLERWPLAAPL